MLHGVWAISPGSLHSTGVGFFWDRRVFGNLSLMILLPSSSILGVGAPEEGEPGIKVFSSSAWAQRGPPQVQARLEKDGDHLYQPQDDARDASARVPFWMPAPEVQNGPEEDRDHLYHPQDNAREVNARVPFWMPAPKVQNDPEEDLDYIHHG